jgi:hypothetical protein
MNARVIARIVGTRQVSQVEIEVLAVDIRTVHPPSMTEQLAKASRWAADINVSKICHK